MWNILNLKCPSNDMVEYKSEDKFQIEKLGDFATILLEAGSALASDDPLWKEIHVLQNIQAKYKRILRCDKCLIYLHRISQCVKKMVLLKLSLSYGELAECLLVGLHDSSGNLYLPSQQQVEYIMIRTQSAAKLVAEAIKYSKDTFCFLVQKLKVGHNILDLQVATSVTARINVLLKGVLIQLYDIYQKVFKWRDEFKKGEFKWPQMLNLPVNLEKWIAAFQYNRMKHAARCDGRSCTGLTAALHRNRTFPITELDENLLTSDFETLDDSTKDTDSVIVVDSENDADCLVTGAEDTDFGEVIPREDSSLTPLQKKLLKKIVLSRSIENLEGLWNGIGKLRQGYLPTRLSTKKSKIISKFLKRAKIKRAKIAHIIKRNPQKESVPVVSEMLAKYLGFTQDQIHSCRNILKEDQRRLLTWSQSTDALKPVKTLKMLRLQYRYLCQMLLSANKAKEQEKLTKKFKRKIADIKLLKKSGEKQFATDLTLCTSKVLLTLCKKSLQL